MKTFNHAASLWLPRPLVHRGLSYFTLSRLAYQF